MLLAGVRLLAAVAEAFPPRDAPAEREEDVAEFVEEAEVGILGDLFPFDVVEIAFEFAEAFDFEHAADYAGELGGH